MRLPAFLKQDGDKLIFKGPGELVYYIPEQYFSNTKTSVGSVIGSYISTIGIFDWALVDSSGKAGKANPFKFPTILLCRPSSIEKVKNLSLNGQEEKDYRVLHFWLYLLHTFFHPFQEPSRSSRACRKVL